MTTTATFTNPKQNFDGSGGASASVPASMYSFSHQDKTTSSCSFIIRKDVLSTYGEQNETNDANPVQIKSTIALDEDGTVFFRGDVTNKREVQGDSNLLEVICGGKESSLLNTFPNFTSLQSWTIQSDFVKVTELPMLASSTFGDFDGDTLWPDPGDATGAKMYIQDADVPQDTSAGIGIGATEIVLSTTNQGFQSRDWIKIVSDEGTEWAHYDGYDDADSPDFTLRNINRGELGTAAIAHVNNITVYNKIRKTIAPVSVVLEHNPGSGFVRLRLNSEFSTLTSLGAFLLQGSASGTYRATYSVYDLDQTLNGGSTFVSVSDVIQRMFTADASFGGAGFNFGADADFTTNMTGDTVTDMQDLIINKYDYDPDKNPHDAWSAIIQAIASTTLDTTIRFWYDHQDDKFRLAFLEQGASVQTISNAKELEKNYDIAQVFSTVRVPWVKDQQNNMIDPDKSFHQEATGTGDSPDIWRRSSSDSPSWRVGINTTSISSGGDNFGMDMLVDQRLDSKLAGEFTHDPGGPFDFGHFWFNIGDGTTPDTVKLDTIEISVNAYRAINAAWQDERNTANTYIVNILGSNDYNTTTNAPATDWFDIGATMEGNASAESISAKGIFKDFTTRDVNAIKIEFEFMCGNKVSSSHNGIVHELKVTGNTKSHVIIQTAVSNPTNDSKLIDAPDTHKKIRGGINSSGGAGVPRSIEFSGVLNSAESATTVGRFFLLTMLLLYQEQFFVVEKALSPIPKLYDTITVNNEAGASYTGINLGIEMGNDGGKVRTFIRLWNAVADVISI